MTTLSASERGGQMRREARTVLDWKRERLERRMPLVAISARHVQSALRFRMSTEELMRRGPSYRALTRSLLSNGPGTTGSRSGARSQKARGRSCSKPSQSDFSFPRTLAPRAGSASAWTKWSTGGRSRLSSAAAIGWSRQAAREARGVRNLLTFPSASLERSARRRRDLGPEVPGIAAAKVGADSGPGAAPKAGRSRVIWRAVGGQSKWRVSGMRPPASDGAR